MFGVLCAVLVFGCFAVSLAHAQTTDQTATPTTAQTATLTPQQQEAEYQAELTQTEADIAKWQTILNNTKAGTASLQHDADVLNAKIQQAKLFIKQKNIEIAQLQQQIADKNANIASLEDQINQGHDSLAQLIRQSNEMDNYTLPEVILGAQNISDFFSDVDTFQAIDKSMADLFAKIRATENLTEQEKAALAVQQNQQVDLAQAAVVQQNQVQTDENQKQYLITVNKTQEKTYAQVLADEQAKAAKIRAALFSLAGGTSAISFGDALTYAQAAASKTGVNPAFLLAILTQESNLGANVGKCYLSDLTSGSGSSVTTGKVWPNLMKPTRDLQPFIAITQSLGLDPLKTVVSCPIAGAGGYGGAMGPAQFIASTWQLFADRLQAVLGHFANPWNPQDAFMASSLYLSDLGAVNGSYSSELRAACKYYGSGGSTCSYGRSVENLETNIQSNIDYLNQYGVAKQ